MSLTVKAYAKLNLWLDITGFRGDGYHTLNAVMRRIDLYDDVTVETCYGGEVTIECDDPNVPTDGWNIAYRAAKAFFAKMRKNVGVNIAIKKRIPVGAGLGGSSADGAAVLTALNELCGRPLDSFGLCSLGAELGADVPFCITGGTARCTGIGEIMQPIDCVDFTALVVVPGFACSTADAYKKYDESPLREQPGFDAFCGGIAYSRLLLVNNMYNVFSELYDDPVLSRLRHNILAAGAEGACMTGSGSAVFGIFADEASAKKAAEGFPGMRTYVVRAL